MDLRVLTWNVFHGRGLPGAGRDLYAEFAGALKGWDWDVALLQEVPPWWPDQLRRTLACEARAALTSRNALLPARRALAVRAPDVMRSAGGGANAILARSDRIVAAGSALLCRWPERRRVLGVELACGVWVSNLHASAGPSPAAERDLGRAVAVSWKWARARRLPLILGGDLNLHAEAALGLSANPGLEFRAGPADDSAGPPGDSAGPAGDAERLRMAASSGVDHLLCSDPIEVVPGTIARPEHGTLSDHAPLAVTLVI